MQGDITECFLVALVPPKVDLHGGIPLLPVGASEDRDHLVESTGHSDNSCWESMESASECDIGQRKKGIHLVLVKALCQQLYSRLGHSWHNWSPDCKATIMGNRGIAQAYLVCW